MIYYLRIKYAKKGEIMSRQSRKNRQRGKHRKKRRSIDRKKLAIVIACLFVTLFLLFKIVQGITLGVSTAKDNVNSLVTAVFGKGKDTSNVNTDKQFDLEEEDNVPDKKHVVYIDVGHGGVDIGYETKDGKKENTCNDISKTEYKFRFGCFA